MGALPLNGKKLARNTASNRNIVTDAETKSNRSRSQAPSFKEKQAYGEVI